MEALIKMIEEQQKGHENTDVFMVGEQLKDIAASDLACAEILEKDLAVEAMGLVAAAAKLKAYADQNRGKLRCFCISPKVADKILREFYGLPDMDASTGIKTAEQPASDTLLDLDSFL